MGLTRIALTRPVFILMLMVLTVLMGTLSYFGMRQEENPEVNFGVVTVSTVYPGAGPEEVNTLVSRKIEEAVSGVAGLREVTSTSQEGISVVVAQFEIESNMDEALNEVRAKVDAIVTELPRAVEKPSIDKIDMAASPVLSMVLRSDKYTSQQLRDLADDKFKDRFARITGVASVAVQGGAVREIQIRLKKDRLLSFGVGITDVQRSVLAATLTVPSGHIDAGKKEFSVRVKGEYQSVAEVADTPISIRDPNKQGGRTAVVRLRDIADVEDAAAERRSWSRLDGSDTVVMTVSKARAGNAIQISQEADAVIRSIETEFGVKVVTTENQSNRIRESLFDLNSALFIGIALVALIVYVFLHNLRGMIIVAVAIPVCLFGTFVALNLLGFTINNMSMMAMSLAIGVLVDDAIVVLENIYRHLKLGEDPYTAALKGRSEIGLAAIAITLADVVVFVPIATMGGVVGQFFKPLGVAFVVATLLSLFVSFTVTPMLAARWYRAGEDVEHPTGRFASAFERGFGRLQNFYRRVLHWALNHRWFVFVSGFVVLVGVFFGIAGGFSPDFGSALSTGFTGLVLCVLVGLGIFGALYTKAALRSGVRWAVFGVLAAAAFFAVVGGPMSMPLPFKIVLGAIAASALPWLILGPFAFVANLFSRHLQSRLVGNAALFGGYLIFATLAGFAYGQWKGEAVFKFGFFPPSDSGIVSVSLTLQPGASLSETERVAKDVEDIVRKHPDTRYVVTQIGSRGGGGFSSSEAGTNYAQVRITLNEKASPLDKVMFWKKHEETLRTTPDTSVAADMLSQIGKIPGVEYTVSAASAVGFGAPIQMSFAGDDRRLLLDTVRKIKARLDEGAVKGVISPDISSKAGKPEIQAIPDRLRLADVDLTAADLANTMRVLYEGNDDAKFRVLGREYDIRVMMDPKDRNDPDIVSQVPLAFVEGSPVRVSDVADLHPGVGLDKIDRRNREEEIRLNADLLPGFAAGTVQAQIDQLLDNEKLVPAGVRIRPLGQADVQAREGIYLFSALIIAFVLVYMLLASLYNNLLYPMIIQFAQPQAMVGALLALILTDKILNIVGMVGIITLVGLVGKNAILLVDYTNTLRERGHSRHDALVEAGPTRLRPIMMTTLALILGMLPVALAIGRGSEFRETIGITIIGGIMLSTVLTLVVIPCSYTIFDDLSLWIGGKLRRLTGREAATVPAFISPDGKADGELGMPHASDPSQPHPSG